MYWEQLVDENGYHELVSKIGYDTLYEKDTETLCLSSYY